MNRMNRLAWTWAMATAILAAAGSLSLAAGTASADDTLKAKQLVEKARLTWQAYIADPNMADFRDLAKRAKGILIAPQILKGAIVLGASGGSGVLLARDSVTGAWAGPGFYTIGSVSIGLQIGGKASEVILLAMTDRGVTALLASSFKLGADVGVALGPMGIGASAATANLSADILAFARSKGLYGGISLDGAVVKVRDTLNDAYYGKLVRPTDIFVTRSVKNPHADALIQAVAKEAGGR